MALSSTDFLDKVMKQAKFSDVFTSNITYICGQNVLCGLPSCSQRRNLYTPHVALLFAWSFNSIERKRQVC